MIQNTRFKYVSIALVLASASVWAISSDAPELHLVSQNQSGEAGNQFSLFPQLSKDGSRVVFQSRANNLTADGNNGRFHIYTADPAVDGSTSLVSVTKSNPGNGNSTNPSISGDGNSVVFETTASNLVNVQNAALKHILMKKLDTENLSQININKAGIEANANSSQASVNENGNWVVFQTLADNLIDTDTNSFSDIYLKNTVTGELILITRSTDGSASDGDSSMAKISAAGDKIVFLSSASNLVADDTNGLVDAFLYDRNTNGISLISHTTSGTSIDNLVTQVDISGNGNYVTYSTKASNIVTGPDNGYENIYVYQLDSAKIENITATANGDSFSPSISDNGRFISFVSSATNLSAQDQSPNVSLYFYDRVRKTINLASHNPATQQNANQDVSPSSAISGDGSVATFVSSATNLIGSASKTRLQVYAYFQGPVPNTSPVAVLNYQNSFECTGNAIAVGLNGSQSYDPDGDAITYRYDSESFPVITIANPMIDLSYGAHDFSLTVYDDRQASSTVFGHIDVVDSIAPLFTGSEYLLLEAESLQGTYFVPDYSFVDDCGISQQSQLPQSSYLGLGKHTFTLSATDRGNNTTQVQAMVDVVDTTAPVIAESKDIIVEASGKLSPVSLVEPAVEEIFPYTLTRTPATDTFPLGTSVVTWNAVDSNGNKASMQQSVIVQDTKAPELKVNNNVILEASTRQGSPYLFDYTVSDACDCGEVTVSISPELDFYPLGTTAVTITATDSSGNITTQLVSITVKDTTAPEFTQPKDLTIEAKGAQTQYLLELPQVTDLFEFELSHDAPASFPLGITIVNWTAVDSNGNKSHVKQSVTVRDTTAPVLQIPADILMEATGLLTPVILGQASATDLFDYSIKHNAPEVFPIGYTIVTWTATDIHGNSASDTQVVTVMDTTAPAIDVSILKTKLEPHHKKHKWVKVAIVNEISDLVDNSPNHNIEISSNYEHDEKHRHHRDHKDWKITNDGQAQIIWLRAEKARHMKEDRVYYVDISASDRFMNTDHVRFEVVVAHDHGKHKGHKHKKSDQKHSKHHKH